MAKQEERGMIFLSLGAGVQSSVMLMMAIKGEIERPDHVIFADTGFEPQAVYKHVTWCEKQCVKALIPFHIVSEGNLKEDMLNSRTGRSGGYAGRWAAIPVFVDTGKATEGRIRRQCSSEYKINPIRKKQRELLGYKKGRRIPPDSCAVMIGISTDEARRAAPAKDRWVENIYPLIDPLKMSRADCQSWWEMNYPHIALRKSACKGCPNKSDREWLRMKLENPGDFAEICDFDEGIRKVSGMVGDSYIHRSLKPLAQVDFNDAQFGLDLEDEIYCSGGCGL